MEIRWQRLDSCSQNVHERILGSTAWGWLWKVPRTCLTLTLFSALVLGVSTQSQADVSPSTTVSDIDLRLPDLVRLVLERNETLQGRLMSFEAQRRRAHGEYGIFEPELYGSVTHEVNNRKNTAEQQASLLGAPTFNETNNIYESGIQSFIPTGAKVQLGYSLHDLFNNLQPTRGVTNGEFQTFFGVTVTQPLLKNFGTAASMAGIRMAAISNKMAFQEYRRELMGLISATEATYWNLYLAQEQVRFFEESVKTAEQILRDNRTRLEAGKGSELDVLEAQAGVGLRQAKLGEARQKVTDAVNRVLSLMAQEAPSTPLPVRAVDAPQIASDLPDFQALRPAVFESNPDYLVAEERVQQAMVRHGFAKNQRLPEFNIKGSYGLNGLGDSPGTSFEDVEHQSEPSWYIGAELHIPLAGGMRTRAEVSATRLELESSERALRGVQIELLNALNTAWNKLKTTRGSVTNYQVAVSYNQNLFQAALTRLDAGKLDSRKVLEVEGDLLEARVSVVESLVQSKLASLEVEMVQGQLLRRRHLEITQAELQAATHHLDKSRYPEDDSAMQTAAELARLRTSPEDPRYQPLFPQSTRDQWQQSQMNADVENGFAGKPEPHFGREDSRFTPLPLPGDAAAAEQFLRDQSKQRERELKK
jgi:outer membrane protein